LKLLVTGGLGFIGSNFIKHIVENKEIEIINVDAEFFGSSRSNLSEIKNLDNYEFVKGNITNRKLMEKLISKSDVIINFAAQSHVDRSISDANPFLVSNIKGVFTILDILKDQKKKMIQISTDEVYGTILEGSAIEKDRFNPSSPYSATKASAELLINSYVITYGLDVIITRCTNNYGKHQFVEKLIPKTIGLCRQDRKIPIYGNGNSIRDWIHVQDHCEAIMTVLEKGRSGESYNISASQEINNLTIAKKILKLLDKPEDQLQFGEERPGEDVRYSLDSTKIQKELGWKPKISFDEGLESTVNWYMSHDNRWWNHIPEETYSNTPWKNKY
jgi:dTDP-glucose 4,6-dehydratase|tara:strand:- start:1306 stop:2298 length:993 start_codon:yes stop_codon:yes gene_type:complete